MPESWLIRLDASVNNTRCHMKMIHQLITLPNTQVNNSRNSHKKVAPDLLVFRHSLQDLIISANQNSSKQTLQEHLQNGKLLLWVRVPNRLRISWKNIGKRD